MSRVSRQSSGSRFIIKSVNMPHFQINGAEGKQDTISPLLLQSTDVRTRSSDHKMQCSVLRQVESTPRCLRYVPTYRGEAGAQLGGSRNMGMIVSSTAYDQREM